MLHGRLDVLDLLTFITPHQEHAGLNAVTLRQPHGLAYLSHLYAALHRIQHPLRPALRADPDAEAAHLRECGGYRRAETVRARDALKRHANAAALHLRRVSQRPAGMNGEDIVGVPQHVRLITFENPLGFIRHRCDGSPPMGLAERGMAAPAAMIRTAASRDERDRPGS